MLDLLAQRTHEFLNLLRRGGAYSHFHLMRATEGKGKRESKSIWYDSESEIPLPAVKDGWEVYFGVHPTTMIPPTNSMGKPASPEHVRSQTKYIAVVNAFFSEYDAKDYGSLEAALAHILALARKPSIKIASGGGYHCYWLLHHPYMIKDQEDREHIRRLQARWVSYVGGDPGAKDLARIMRLPGYFNHKYSPPRPVNFLDPHYHPELRYSLEELIADLPPEEAFALLAAPKRARPAHISLAAQLQNPFAEECVEYWTERAVKRAGEVGRNETGLWLACQLRDRGHSREEALSADYPELVEGAGDHLYTRAEYERSVNQAYSRSPRDNDRPGDEPLLITSDPTSFIGIGLDQGKEKVAPGEYDNSFPPAEDEPEGGLDGRDQKKSKKRTITDRRISQEWINLSALQGRLLEFGQGEFRVYQNGHWPALTQEQVESEIVALQEAAEQYGYNTTAGKRDSAISLARSILGGNRRPWDENPNILVLENGTLDLNTLQVRPHSSEDYMTTALPYKYDPEATCPNTLKALENLGDAQKIFQQFAGYCLTVETKREKAIWLTGKPGGGKSTVLSILETLLVGNVGQLGMSDLKGDSFGLEGVNGKRLLIATEQPDGFFEGARGLNKIISGELLKVNRKYRTHIEFKPIAKIAWAMNALPRIASPNDGTFRRLILIHVPPIPKDRHDVDLKETISKEAAGILNWALDGLRSLRAEGGFNEPASVKDAREQYQEESDILGLFLREGLQQEVGHDEPAQVMYNSYKLWNDMTGHRKINQHSFARELQERGMLKKRTNKGLFWLNVRIKAEYRAISFAPTGDDDQADIPF